MGAVILIGINFWDFKGFSSNIIDENQLDEWISENKVQQIEIINNSEVVVTINKKYLNDAEFSNKGKRGNNLKYYFEIPDGHSSTLYQDLLNKSKEKKKSGLSDENNFKVVSRTEENLGKDIFGWIIFFGIMIAIWSFI